MGDPPVVSKYFPFSIVTTLIQSCSGKKIILPVLPDCWNGYYLL